MNPRPTARLPWNLFEDVRPGILQQKMRLAGQILIGSSSVLAILAAQPPQMVLSNLRGNVDPSNLIPNKARTFNKTYTVRRRRCRKRKWESY